MKISFVTTGGTIDKVYFDANSEYAVGDPVIPEILREACAILDYEVVPLFRKDSLEITDDDRRLVREAIESRENRRFVVTHGTDTMVRTALALRGLSGKTIVLTGSLAPARFRQTDAVFNIASAVAAVQCLGEGVWVAMNGRIFEPERVRKNRETNRFEEIE